MKRLVEFIKSFLSSYYGVAKNPEQRIYEELPERMYFCRDCKYWVVKKDNIVWGECRRYPHPNGLQTIKSHWCGEMRVPTVIN